MNRLTADLFVRSMSKQISRGFWLKICVRAKWIEGLINQKAVTQMLLRLSINCLSYPDIDLRRIKATAEPYMDPLYMESPNSLLRLR